MKIQLLGGTEISVTYGDENIKFITSGLIHQTNFKGMDPFKLLMKYLNYRGEEYKDELFNRLKLAHAAILNSIHNREVVYTKEVYSIIDIIDVMDIYNYIKNVYKFKPPANLKTEFTKEDDAAGRWNRDQTLIVDEYLELVALGLALKILIGPIGLFVHHNFNKKEEKKEYRGFKFIRNSKLFESSPMVKAYKFIMKLVEQSANTKIIIINEGLSIDELPAYLLSIYCFKKLAPTSLMEESNVNNIVNTLFNHTTNKLRPGGDVSRTIRPKSVVIEGGDDGSNSSVMEAYKATTDLSPGQIVEYNWAVDTIEKVMHNSADYITQHVKPEDIKYALSRVHLLKESVISNETQALLSIIFKDTINPKAVKHLKYVADYVPYEKGTYVSPMLNLLIVGYAYLKGIGLPELARILTAKEILSGDEEDTIVLNPTNSKTRISTAEKELLNEYYLSRDTGALRVNMAEEWVNTTANSYYSKTWIATDDNPGVEVLCNNIRNLLCSLLIQIEKDRVAEKKQAKNALASN